jgi:D-arabinose 1-dehydrogenase-like Zn-dependent alcohol dehydrogenase
MGAYVVAFTGSENKREAARRLGADEVVVSHDGGAMARCANQFDFILDTVAAAHDLTVDEAFDRMQRSDVRYRFVIDNSTLKARVNRREYESRL